MQARDASLEPGSPHHGAAFPPVDPDLGCGTGMLTILARRAHPDASVTGLDADPAVLHTALIKAPERASPGDWASPATFPGVLRHATRISSVTADFEHCTAIQATVSSKA